MLGYLRKPSRWIRAFTHLMNAIIGHGKCRAASVRSSKVLVKVYLSLRAVLNLSGEKTYASDESVHDSIPGYRGLSIPILRPDDFI